jgi:hypothetical protein
MYVKNKTKIFDRLIKKIVVVLNELPRQGFLWPYPITRLLIKLNILNRNKFKYSTPTQHYYIMPAIMVRKIIIKLSDKAVKPDIKKAKNKICNINKQLKKYYSELEKLCKIKKEINGHIELFRELSLLEQQKEKALLELDKRQSDIQQELINEFIEYFQKFVKTTVSNIEKINKLQTILKDLLFFSKNRNQQQYNFGAQSIAFRNLSEQINIPEEILLPIIKKRKIDSDIALYNKIIIALEKTKRYERAIKELKELRFYSRAQYLVKELNKKIISPVSYLTTRGLFIYNFIFNLVRHSVAALVSIGPILLVYGVGGILHLPIITFFWIPLTFVATYQVVNYPAQKIALLIGRLFVITPGHKMVNNLQNYLDSNYSEQNPLRLSYFIMKKSGNLSDILISEFYIEKTLKAIKPTLQRYGNKLEIIFIFGSDTQENNLINYEINIIKKISKRYGFINNLYFLYLNRSKNEWYDNTNNSELKIGGFAGKVGGIGAILQLLCTGKTRPCFFTDDGYEHSQNPNKPLFSHIWSSNFTRIFGNQSTSSNNDTEIINKILTGKEINKNNFKVPKFTILADDKNELFHGELEKALAILFHPSNRNIVIAQPFIQITPPHNALGARITSKWWEFIKKERDIDNMLNTRFISGIHRNEKAFYGKGIVKTKEYYHKIFASESLSPSKVRSHDWQESVFCENCQGLFGSSLFKVKTIKIFNDEILLRIDMANNVKFIKIKRTPDNSIIVYMLNKKNGRYNLERKINYIDEEASTEEVITHVTNFYNNTVSMGERDQLHMITHIMRDLRWLIGDIQALRTLLPYKNMLTSYHRWHLYWLSVRLLNDPALLLFLLLINLIWVLGPLIKIPIFRSAYILSLMIMLIGVIFISRFLDPFIYFLKQKWSEGKQINIFLIASFVVERVIHGIKETFLTFLANLQLSLSKTSLIFSVYLAEKKSKIPAWKTSTELAIMERQNKVCLKNFNSLKIFYNPIIGTVLLFIIILYVFLGLAPPALISIFGLLPWILSLLFGNYVINFLGKCQIYIPNRHTGKLVKNLFLYTTVFIALVSIFFIMTVRNIPSYHKSDFVKLIIPERKDRFMYSTKENKIIKEISNKIEKINFYSSPVLRINNQKILQDLKGKMVDQDKKMATVIFYAGYPKVKKKGKINFERYMNKITELGPKYPNLDLNKKGRAEWLAVFAVINNINVEEMEKKYFIPAKTIFKKLANSYTEVETDILLKQRDKITVSDIIIDAAIYNLQIVNYLNLSIKEVEKIIDIMKKIKVNNLNIIKNMKNTEEVRNWQRKVNSMAYELFYIEKLIFEKNGNNENIKSLHRYSSFDEFLYQFLTNMQSLYKEIKIWDIASQHNLEFYISFWMTFKGISVEAAKNIILEIDNVNLNYKKIFGFAPEVGSSIPLNEAINRYRIGKYGVFFSNLYKKNQKKELRWWTDYIVKNAYRKLFNINLHPGDTEDKIVLKDIYRWIQKEKLYFPNKYIFTALVNQMMQKGAIEQISFGRLIFQKPNQYQERIDRIKRYILTFDFIINSFKKEKYDTKDIEEVRKQTKNDLISLERVSKNLIKETTTKEKIFRNKEDDYNQLLLITDTIVTVGLAVLMVMVLILGKKRED